jgi:hypothetical protein
MVVGKPASRLEDVPSTTVYWAMPALSAILRGKAE